MSKFMARIERGEILLADGATGSYLFQRGLEAGACPDACNLEHPEWLADLAEAYAAAGSDFVVSNTFGATRLKLAPYGLADRVKEINAAAVNAARRGIKAYREKAGAAARTVYLSGNLGPTGSMMKPYGDTDPGEVAESYREQCAALASAGVDAFTVETMMDLAEARLAVQAAKEAAPLLPVTATLTFDRTPRGFFSIMGVSVEQAARGLAAAGADAVGANCGHGSEEMLAVAEEFARHTELPLIVQPNAGLPETIDGRLVYSETPEIMARIAVELVATGVRILGACCGSTPEHIRALRAVADAANRDRASRA